VRGPSATLLYLPDVDSWEGWDVAEALRGVDVALVDGTFFDADELPDRDTSDVPHPPIATSLALLTPFVRAGVRAQARDAARHGGTRILFTHLNHSNPAADPSSDAARQVREAGHAIAYDGQRFEL